MNLKNNLSSNGKFIYMSSTEIYSGNNKLCNENSVGFTSTSHIRSPYIESKRFGESFIMNSNINYLIYRVCLIFGPGGKINDERIINLLLQRSILNKNIDLYGSLKQSRSNLYITDAVNLIIKSLVRYNKEIFNLNNNQMTTIEKISQIISKISNKKIKKHKNLIKGSPKIIKISNKKILKYTNYKISTNLKDGLFKTYKWYYNLINN
jgi:nucleoside-diphosphate-sugar epimerase